MGKNEKLMVQILRGAHDANIPFDDLMRLLRKLGFLERTRGSHHIFRMTGVEEKINLQADGSHAKPYQIRQVRMVMLKHSLKLEE